MGNTRKMESRESLSEIYWSDLLELLEQGEISASRARIISNDMFENQPGDTPLLREPYWQIYVRELTTDLSNPRPGLLSRWFATRRD